MARALLLGVIALIAVIVVFAIVVPAIHFLFLVLIAAAIVFVAFRVGRRSRR